MGGRPVSVREVAVLAAFTLACIGAIFAAWLAFGGSLPLQAKGYRFNVAFPEARTLVANADVRIAGVPVGKVVKVTPGEDATDAVLELKPRFAPLPSDARAIIRNKTPLGESFVEITRGSPDVKPIPDGGWMSSKNVARTQQIEQVLGAFDAKTRNAFRTFLLDATATLDGKSFDLNQALGATGPTVESTGEVVRALDAQSNNVQTLVSRTGQALRALGERPEDLRRLVRSGDTVLSATAQRNREITATVRALAPFVGELRTTMVRLQRTVALAAPTLRTLRPVTPLLTPALRRIDSISPVATQVLEDLRPVLRSLTKASGPARQLISATRVASAAIDANGRQAIPPLQLFDAYKKDAIYDLGSAASSFNYASPGGGGQVARAGRAALSVISSEGQLGAAKRPPSNRANAYPAPGTQKNLTTYSCANLKNPESAPLLGTQIPCTVEPPWNFLGETKSFPQLSPYVPNGK